MGLLSASGCNGFGILGLAKIVQNCKHGGLKFRECVT